MLIVQLGDRPVPAMILQLGDRPVPAMMLQLGDRPVPAMILVYVDRLVMQLKFFMMTSASHRATSELSRNESSQAAFSVDVASLIVASFP